MICQTADPAKMIETLASLIIKDGSGFSDALVFVPTRRAARKLEHMLSEKSGGAALLPRIVGLGEGDDDDVPPEAIGNMERKIILAKILLSVAGGIGVQSNFSGVLPVASELITMADYMENEGLDAKAINWNELVKDEKKAAFLNALKDLDWGLPTTAEARNRGIKNWKSSLSKYKKVFCCGSTASVKPTRDLMKKIAGMPNGCVILPGLLRNLDDIGRADPYWSIKKFVADISLPVETLDVREPPAQTACAMDFFNDCFNNDLSGRKLTAPENITEIECNTESEEANVIAAVSALAKENGESVLIITPDISGEQRIRAALSGYGLSVDSSSGAPLSQTHIGRAAMLVFDYLLGTENPKVVEKDLSLLADAAGLDKLKYEGDLFDFIRRALETLKYKIDDKTSADAFFDAVSELSDILKKYDLPIADAAEIFKERMRSESVRAPMGENYDVSILGTAEARMQTADVVIITGLNEGMFPKPGWEHSWLPKDISHKIGLPSSDSKVSLMALDFMTLSCNKKVYWTRSKAAGGAETIPSRFLSRVHAKAEIRQGFDILSAVRAADDVPFEPLDRTPPACKYEGDYYATWLEDLVHNPYLFYARHILNLRVRPDAGEETGAREFGIFVHEVLEAAARNNIKSADEIVRMLETAALKHIDRKNILFMFWQNRFREIAPVVAEMLSNGAAAKTEEKIQTNYKGRKLIARADRIENESRVIDYKTGSIPTNAQLGLDKDENCTMPQLPAEAMMLDVPSATMAFLCLRKNHAGLKEFGAEETARAIAAVKKKLNIILNLDKFERPEHVDEKYRDFDDLCRAGD